MNNSVLEKLKILADSAKYDVSCASSGITRKNNGKGIGNTAGWGICHSFTEDGRCVSLLKVMLTNHCVYDCAYCSSRRSNDIKRTTFTVKELVDLTIGFYRRNYIEGLFLSSGVLRNPDYTMERMIRVAKDLRIVEKYNGYIHLKTIPGATTQQVQEAGMYADRLSVNIEIANENNLKYLAPEKDHKSVLGPMSAIRSKILENKNDRKTIKKLPKFAPAGQSTQLIIGATSDTDRQILYLSAQMYNTQRLKRVYYSGYLPVNKYDARLPVLSEPPLKRENRLYQADWLFRFYHFSMNEIVSEQHPNLDLEVDPKLGYALRHPEIFPVDVNSADYKLLLRVPGIGPKSAQMIVQARKYRKLNYYHLKKIGVVLKRAKYFISCNELPSAGIQEIRPEILRQLMIENKPDATVRKREIMQLSLF
ncbi:putative DNA modification/repair radical SAM protein [Bacteroidota bacterium]